MGQGEYFVMGAVAVYENQAYYLSESFDRVQEKWFPDMTSPIEFHSSNIRAGRGTWRQFQSKMRDAILQDLCQAILDVNPRGLMLFGVAMHKSSFGHDDPVEKSFHELCGHFDAFLNRTNAPVGAEKDQRRDRNRGLMVLDSQRYTGHLDKLLLEYRRKGTKFGRVKNYADAPAFADSKTTRLLQAADLVSYAVYRRYEEGDAKLLDKLLPRFDQDQDKIHGLMHLVSKWRECLCPACMSRKLT